MASNLDQLLANIHPTRTVQQTAQRADNALNTFAPPTAQITDWNKFRRLMAAFFGHVEASLLRLRSTPQANDDLAWGRATAVLVQAYGASGEKAAFEMARTGNEGGLYAVLKKVARTMAEQYTDREISARVNRFWTDLSAAERLEVAEEYLSQYGPLLPSELTEASAARVWANMPGVLTKHPHLVDQLARIGRG